MAIGCSVRWEVGLMTKNLGTLKLVVTSSPTFIICSSQIQLFLAFLNDTMPFEETASGCQKPGQTLFHLLCLAANARVIYT
jgi:hypothetical protein